MTPTTRFSNRVADYLKYRPSYPPALISHLQQQKILTPTSLIADIGSGTGLLTQLFLRTGNTVYGIEPNPDMRTAGELYLQHFPNFHSLPATAEATTLPSASIDLITAGQSFHWFNRDQARTEFRRILRPNAHVALIWNERQVKTSPFLQAYENLLHTYSDDYQTIDHRHITGDIIAQFFHPSPLQIHTFPNQQTFDYESLQGRLLSSSYAPPTGHPHHAPMLADLQKIFHAHQQNHQILFTYETKLYTAQI